MSITNKTSDVEEDCNCNPVIKEKFEELSNEITTLQEMKNELKSDFPIGDEYPIICEILNSTHLLLLQIARFMINLGDELGDEYPILIPILLIPEYAIVFVVLNLWFIGLLFFCDWAFGELPDLLNVVREMNDIKI